MFSYWNSQIMPGKFPSESRGDPCIFERFLVGFFCTPWPTNHAITLWLIFAVDSRIIVIVEHAGGCSWSVRQVSKVAVDEFPYFIETLEAFPVFS